MEDKKYITDVLNFINRDTRTVRVEIREHPGNPGILILRGEDASGHTTRGNVLFHERTNRVLDWNA